MVYTFEPAGFSFEYGPGLAVVEKTESDGLLGVVLEPIKNTTNTSAVAFGELEPRIQCTLFHNTEALSPSKWVQSPNYALLFGHIIPQTTYPSVDIPNQTALGFKTDGLYASDHVAFEHNGYIIDCSVGYITLDDPLRMNFVTFLSNIKLSSN